MIREAIDSCVIITTQPNQLLQPLHDRMPAIVSKAQAEQWIAKAAEGDEAALALRGLLAPHDDPAFHAYPVSMMVNKPEHDDPRLIERVEKGQSPEAPPSLFG